MKFFHLLVAIQFSFLCLSQEEEETEQSFTTTRIINGHSVETLEKGALDIRIEHRFGDIAGSNGGWQSLYGFDNVSDMRIAAEYGITNHLMIGAGRSKGNGNPYRHLLDGFVKYKALSQKKGEMPLSLAFVGGSSFTYMKASSDLGAVSHFPKAKHRLAYFVQANLAHHFGDRAAIALMPTFVHRNYVGANDQNSLFTLGAAGRLRITNRFALVMEYYHAFSSEDTRNNGFANSLGVGLEWFTFGHSFTLLFSNASGLGETQFIPHTTEKWTNGQFRFGFCISRKFSFE